MTRMILRSVHTSSRTPQDNCKEPEYVGSFDSLSHTDFSACLRTHHVGNDEYGWVCAIGTMLYGVEYTDSQFHVYSLGGSVYHARNGLTYDIIVDRGGLDRRACR